MAIKYSVIASYYGKEIPASILANRLGIDPGTMRDRVKAGKRDAELEAPVEGPGAKKGCRGRPVTLYGDFFGRRVCVKDLAKMCTVPLKTLSMRLRYGLRDEKLIMPVQETKDLIRKMAEAKRNKAKAKEIINAPKSYSPDDLPKGRQEETNRYSSGS